jgi:hypothetical protein
MSLERTARLDGWRAVLVFCAIAAGLQILLGGIRAVDGTSLAQVAQDGFSASIENFSQYIFDSPLKVLFLKTVGITSPAGIAVLFMVLAFLPFPAALLAPDAERRKTCLLMVAALPVTHVAFSILGSGDSVMMAGAVAIIVTSSRWLVAVVAAAMIGWHMQQGVIILAMLASVMALAGDQDSRRKLPWLVAGALAGFAVYMACRWWLMPPYRGRAGFMLQHMERFALRMVFYWPVAMLVAVPGLLAVWLAMGLRGLHWIAWLAIAGAFVVSGLTSDVSRVFFVLIFPVLLFSLLSPRIADATPQLRRLDLLVPVLALSSVVPLFNFSGIEIFDWKALVNLAIKYGGPSEWLSLFLKLEEAF